MLPLPDFYNKSESKSIRSIDYESILKSSSDFKVKHHIKDSKYEKKGNALVLFDYQIYNIDKTGDHLSNLSEFIYKNIKKIQKIYVFHRSPHILSINSPVFWVNSRNQHPTAGTIITLADLTIGTWKATDGIKSNYSSLGEDYVTKYIVDYFNRVKTIEIKDVEITYLDMESAIIPSVMESVYSHSCMRSSQPHFISYGNSPLVEPLSAFSHKMTDIHTFTDNTWVINRLKNYSQLIFAGLDSRFLIENIKECHNTIGDMKRFHILKDCSVIDNDNFEFKKMTGKGLNIFYNTKEFR